MGERETEGGHDPQSRHVLVERGDFDAIYLQISIGQIEGESSAWFR